jgi:Skp family chaperone for outer membrane proteins
MNSKLISRITMIGLAVSAIAVSSATFAQTTPAAAPAPTDIPGHPRVNEVNQRLDNQQQRIQNGVADGQINAKQEARDESHDANIAQRESRDEAEHGGHLTKAEQRHLNKSLNKNSGRIHKQRTAK